MSRRPTRVRPALPVCWLALCILAATPAAGQIDLNGYWAAHAVPEGDYDRVCDLDSLAIYTGSLYLTSGSNCLRGHGAILDLDGGVIRALGINTRLDIECCVIMDGGTPGIPESAALNFRGGTKGSIENCVFYANRSGLWMEEIYQLECSVRNCIFLLNEGWGCIIDGDYIPEISHCCAYRNGETQPPGDGGHYAAWCGCSSIPPVAYEPPAGAGCMVDDPDLVRPDIDPAAADFHLAIGSPCIGAGDPPGCHIGAYQEVVTPVEPITWGRVKRLYR